MDPYTASSTLTSEPFRAGKLGGGEDGHHCPETDLSSAQTAAERCQNTQVATSLEFPGSSSKQIVSTLADRGTHGPRSGSSPWFNLLNTTQSSSKAPSKRECVEQRWKVADKAWWSGTGHTLFEANVSGRVR